MAATTTLLPRGRVERNRIAWETSYGVTPGGNFTELNVYATELDRSRPLEDDEILGAGFANNIDSLPAAPSIEDATFKYSVPLDAAQLGWWLAAALGRVVHSGSAPNVHTFASGAGQLTSFSLEREFVAAAQYEELLGGVVKTIKFPFGPGKGYQMIDLTGVGSKIVEPYASTVGGTPVVEALASRMPKSIGLIKIDTTQVGKVISGDLTLTNDITLDRYVGDSAFPSLAALDGQSVEINATVRYADDTWRNYGAVGAGILPAVHQLDVVYQLTASLMLTLTCVNVRFEPVNVGTTNGKTRTVTLKGRAELDATHPMLTAVLKNAHADY